MTNRVLIGKVKNERQLKVNFDEKFYHIPETVMPKNMLPVGYVALYFTESGDAGKNAVCIRYCGRVIKTELVLREDISSLPSSNIGKKYYKFTVDEWQEVPNPIIRDRGGVFAKAFTDIESLLSSKRLSELVHRDMKPRRKRSKASFSEEQIANVRLSEDFIGVTALAELISAAGETKIIPTKITKYLVENGYLKIKPLGEKDYRVATPKGQNIGIFSDRAERGGKEYYLTLYDKNAQQFVLDHINEIVKLRLKEAYLNK